MKDAMFPDKIGAREELKRDVLYHKIPEQDRIRVCDLAWEKGVDEAKKLLEKYPKKEILEMAKLEGLKVIFSDEKSESKALRIYAEYDVKERTMTLYEARIAAWAEEHGLTKEAAKAFVMAHEYYHFLECTKIGSTSKLYTLPTLKLGKWILMTSGIRALSEIGAHGFAFTYFEEMGFERRADLTVKD